jgi:hypothetical protein
LTVWNNVGDKMMSAILRLDIEMDDLPWVDGRLDVVTLLKLYMKGKSIEDDTSKV